MKDFSENHKKKKTNYQSIYKNITRTLIIRNSNRKGRSMSWKNGSDFPNSCKILKNKSRRKSKRYNSTMSRETLTITKWLYNKDSWSTGKMPNSSTRFSWNKLRSKKENQWKKKEKKAGRSFDLLPSNKEAKKKLKYLNELTFE